MPTRGQLHAAAVVLVGMGDAKKLDGDALRRAGASLAKRAAKVSSVATTVLDATPDGLDRADAAQALAEGVRLGAYQFLKYKGDGKPSQLKKVVVLGRSSRRCAAALERGARIAEAVAWARDLVNEPGAKSPEDIANSRARSGAPTGSR